MIDVEDHCTSDHIRRKNMIAFSFVYHAERRDVEPDFYFPNLPAISLLQWIS